MNYIEWAEQYRDDARRVHSVIERKKALLNDKNLTADTRKSINDVIVSLRGIYRELLRTAELLHARGESYHEA